jgi:hypothetical protein
MRNSYEIVVGKSAGKRRLERPRQRWDIITIDSREIECESEKWIDLL